MNNFAWICTWKITHRCNLSCTYCNHSVMKGAAAAEHNDYARICASIEKLAPKIVNISGGEPTLVERLPEIVQRLKKNINPFIRIVHNGTQPDKAVDIFPFIDRFVVSMDGPGRINAQTRGIDGDRVLDRLAHVVDKAEAAGVELAINTVVTIRNAAHIKELADTIHAVSRSIILSLTPVMPPDGPESILSHPDMHGAFLKAYSELKKNRHNIIHTFDSLERHTAFSCIQCYNQFFVVRVTPEGRVSACPMNVALGLAAAHVSIRELLSAKGMKKAMNAGKKMLKSKVARTVDFSCSTICNCESWMDMLFLGKNCESAEVYARGLRGRLADTDYAKLDSFVRAYINPDFSINDFRRTVGDVNS